jgi:hypothetical protein
LPQRVSGFCRAAALDQIRIELRSMHIFQRGKSRFIVHLHDRGDNLSVRFYIQNSISLTIAMLPRII